jgi:hypothetical protein
MLRRLAPAIALSLAAALALAACGLKKPSGPSREEVLALLQAEANDLKKGGEQMDPKLRVKVTWNVDGVDLVEQPSDAAHPWQGTIRFKIVTTMHDADGSETNDLIRKNFSYVYDNASKKLMFQSSTTPPK